VVILSVLLFPAVDSIGVNYGTLADNLPPPLEVAHFLRDRTTIDRVKIFDINPDILRAFAGTGISVAVTVPNGDIPSLTDAGNAQRWVAANIQPFYPQTKIDSILVGNEILHWGPQNLRDSLVAAMRTLQRALVAAGVGGINVTTAHSLGILESAQPPSLARFRPGWDTGVLAPVLQFHRETKTPFMVNPYPYFGYDPNNANFSLFLPNSGFFDKLSRRTYGNMFDMLMDAVFVSMKRLGYGDVDIAVGETGWSSLGEAFEQPRCSQQNAEAYVAGLVKKYESGRGTPLMPRRSFQTYLFALFNEDQKQGPLSERNFGLFRPDLVPVYNAGIMRTAAASTTPPLVVGVGVGVGEKKRWCVPKPGATSAALQDNIDYVCSQPNLDCTPIQPGGACFDPNTAAAHASFVMNSFYQRSGRHDFNCYFSGTGILTYADPS
ncbi:glycoside hydrolase, partial [Genlisea aurea]